LALENKQAPCFTNPDKSNKTIREEISGKKLKKMLHERYKGVKLQWLEAGSKIAV